MQSAAIRAVRDICATFEERIAARQYKQACTSSLLIVDPCHAATAVDAGWRLHRAFTCRGRNGVHHAGVVLPATTPRTAFRPGEAPGFASTPACAFSVLRRGRMDDVRYCRVSMTAVTQKAPAET